MGDAALRYLQTDAVHGRGELRPVLGDLDRARLGADQLHAVLLEHAPFGELHRDVERRLSAHRRQECVRLLALDHELHEVGRHRLDVRPVRDLRVRHDGRRVRVHEDHLVTLLPERARGLGARVIELGRLSNDDRPGADHQNPMYVRATRHVKTRDYLASDRCRARSASTIIATSSSNVTLGDQPNACFAFDGSATRRSTSAGLKNFSSCTT